MKSLFVAFALTGASYAAGPRPVTEDEAYTIGVDTYIYAYPMVLMEMTRRVMTNAAEPDPHTLHAPMNRFAHAAAYPDANARDVVRANADTLYSGLFYDVGKEPLIFTLPDTGNRYYVIPFMDMWTDVFAMFGTSTTGNGGGSFALVGPNWKGTLPAGLRAIISPTEVGYVIGRIQTDGAADYDNVHKMQAGLKAVPLSSWGKGSYVPAQGRVDPSIDMTPPPEQIARLAPDAFFAIFADILKRNPPHQADYAQLMRMERIGLVPGQDFDLTRTEPSVQRALTRAAPDAYKRIIEYQTHAKVSRNGWSSPAGMIGNYGNDYLLRAFNAYTGFGALPTNEAIYPSTTVDSEGRPLTGANKYILHFDKNQIPPVNAFWSLTMYGEDQFFVANPVNRYAIGDRDRLAFNADGSLDLYIQHVLPGKDKETNWLPAPVGPFIVNLRLYLPQESVVNGRWTPPPVKRRP